MGQNKYDIFVSYSRTDMDVVNRLVGDIHEKTNARCWVDWNGIESGDQFVDVIINAIDKVDTVLFVLSDNSMSSAYVKKEIIYARNKGKKIIPIVVDGGKLRDWFLFEFGQTDYIDIQSSVQYDKLIVNLTQWYGCSSVVEELQQCTENVLPLEETADSDEVYEPDVFIEVTAKVWQYLKENIKSTFWVYLFFFVLLFYIVFCYIDIPVEKFFASTSTVKRLYEVGDYYSEDGKEGIVFEVYDGGNHGKIVSLDAVEKQWATKTVCGVYSGATYTGDGMGNLNKIKGLPNWKEEYPAFAWCASLGDGWYLPAKEELQKMLEEKLLINNGLNAKGYASLENCHWSSTATDNSRAWSVYMTFGLIYENTTSNIYYVRAVATF